MILYSSVSISNEPGGSWGAYTSPLITARMIGLSFTEVVMIPLTRVKLLIVAPAGSKYKCWSPPPADQKFMRRPWIAGLPGYKILMAKGVVMLFEVGIGRTHDPALTSTGTTTARARRAEDTRNLISELDSVQLFQLSSGRDPSHLYSAQQSQPKPRRCASCLVLIFKPRSIFPYLHIINCECGHQKAQCMYTWLNNYLDWYC